MTYDPNITTNPPKGETRSVTAFFDTQDAANKARTDLIAAGISPDTISVAGGVEGVSADAPPPPAEEGGFWHALKEFFMPDEDRYTYAEGLRRGGYALSVRTGEAQYDRALDILDADGAVDLDEREQSWRSEGWGGLPTDYNPVTADVLMPNVGAGTAGFGASLAGEDGYSPPPGRTSEPGVAGSAVGGTLTTGSADAEARADTSRVGTGPSEPGLLNPDMRERIGSGTASMTPPTPTGAQDATLGDNAANVDRGQPPLSDKARIEDASLGSPTRSGMESPSWSSTVGSTAGEPASMPPMAPGYRRDDSIQRTRVRGYITDTAEGGSTKGGGI